MSENRKLLEKVSARKYYPLNVFIPERGITEVVVNPHKPQFKRFQKLAYYKDLINHCGKCGTCRFTFQSANWSRTCPSGEWGKFESYYLGGRNSLLWNLLNGKAEWDESIVRAFYSCTLCGNCYQQCQIPEIHYFAQEWLEAVREEAVRMGLGPMAGQDELGRNTEKSHNPWDNPHENRKGWVEGCGLEIVPGAEVAFFVGCSSSYLRPDSAKVVSNILEKLDVPVNLLEDEWCCGSPLLRTGQVERAKTCALHNVEEIKRSGARLVITACPGCTKTLREDYEGKFGLKSGVEIKHLTEFLSEEIQTKKPKLNRLEMEGVKKVTYHDPCHGGRHLGIYDQPRQILDAISGIEFVEMIRNKNNAWCCGGGGGVRKSFPEIASFASYERINEAEAVGADAIATSCPFCFENLSETVEKENSKIEICDINRLVIDALA